MPKSLVAVAWLLAAIIPASAAAAGAATGTLTGQTQISYGCPGPVALDGPPSCNPWHAFANARFSIVSSSGPARVVASDSQGRFTVRLAPGSYFVKPLPQANTRGGATIHFGVGPGTRTWILVRFSGFPRME
jgi:hypothetical protein